MEPFPGTSFAVLSVSIVGILTISLLLLAYYLFLTRCGLLFFWRSDLQQLLHDDVAAHHRISVSVTVQEPPRRSGLEEAAIRRIPTFRYRCHGKPHHLLPASAAGECAVCLADFRDGERLRLLPPCLHAFHIDCIDAWLQATANCPLCRAAVVSGPAGMQLPRAAAAANDDDDIVIDIATSTSPSAADVAAEQPAASAAPSDERGSFLPMRRSLSMDSCADKRFYLALQRMILQQNSSSSSGSPAAAAAREDGLMGGSKGEMMMSTAADTGRSSSRRLRRSFFSFSQSRGSRSAVLPL